MSNGRRNHLPLKVVYTGAIKDLSGYASAARDYVRSLDSVGVDVAVDVRTFEAQSRRLIEEVIERRMWTMMGKPKDAYLQIIHLTPDNYTQYRESPRVKIGYYAWETSRLPDSWVRPCNEICHEVWVPCQYLADVSINSGVEVPVHVVPHALPLPSENFKPSCTINSLPNDKYKFYSVFQWSERKNPLALLAAYYQEFTRYDPVVLVLKTYRVGNALSERDFIRREISKLKRATRGVDCPPVLLIEEFLSACEIQAIHHYCDCYVSMARSEGFGIPAFEAAAMGNPVIVPNYSAFPEYFSNKTSYLVDVPNEIPIRNMRHISILYTGDMFWGDPSIEDCRRQMRTVFNNQAAAKKKGQAARKWVGQNLSYTSIGRIMKARIEAINKELSLGR